MSAPPVKSSWWINADVQPSSEVLAGHGSFATVTRVEHGYVHFRYADNTQAGVFHGQDTLTLGEFRQRYPVRRETWEEAYDRKKGMAAP